MIDRYTKFILTIIAICLLTILIKPLLNQEVRAQVLEPQSVWQIVMPHCDGDPVIRFNTVTGRCYEFTPGIVSSEKLGEVTLNFWEPISEENEFLMKGRAIKKGDLR
ncbi:hypothetical protein KAW55_01995 [bacterium]|nr:hypothetical protein [bacterium]